MSTEYVTLVRDWVAAWTNGDPADLGDLQMFAPEVVYEDNILPDHHGETYRGHEGIRKAWARAIEPWESIEGGLEWIKGAGDDVVTCHRGRMRGKGSGLPTTKAGGLDTTMRSR